MSTIKILEQDKFKLVQGGGIVYDIAEFIGYAQEKWNQIDWEEVSESSRKTQEEWDLRD